MSHVTQKPLRWGDSLVKHQPESLPFLAFYLEVREAASQPRFAARAQAWLAGRGAAGADGERSIPPL